MAPFATGRRALRCACALCAPPSPACGPSARSSPRRAWCTSSRSSRWCRRADRPDLADEARHETRGRRLLRLGRARRPAAPRARRRARGARHRRRNCYSFGQMEYREQGPHVALAPRDPRIRPLCDMLGDVWERYRRPMIIGETSGLGDGRPAWLKRRDGGVARGRRPRHRPARRLPVPGRRHARLAHRRVAAQRHLRPRGRAPQRRRCAACRSRPTSTSCAAGSGCSTG
jgi:hypothetical protein